MNTGSFIYLGPWCSRGSLKKTSKWAFNNVGSFCYIIIQPRFIIWWMSERFLRFSKWAPYLFCDSETRAGSKPTIDLQELISLGFKHDCIDKCSTFLCMPRRLQNFKFAVETRFHCILQHISKMSPKTSPQKRPGQKNDPVSYIDYVYHLSRSSSSYGIHRH